MARTSRKKGGSRYRRFNLSLPKRLYNIVMGLTMWDERSANKLIKRILEEKLYNSTIAELEAYFRDIDREEEEEQENGEVKEEEEEQVEEEWEEEEEEE